jgi:2-methylcitrate dehydratase PrpD
MDASLWSDPEIISVIDRIEVYPHAEADGDKSHMAAVSIELKDGRLLETVEEYRIGSPVNPATAAQLDAKVRSLSSTVLEQQRIDTLIQTIYEVEDIENISELSRLLIRGDRRST